MSAYTRRGFLAASAPVQPWGFPLQFRVSATGGPPSTGVFDKPVELDVTWEFRGPRADRHLDAAQ